MNLLCFGIFVTFLDLSLLIGLHNNDNGLLIALTVAAQVEKMYLPVFQLHAIISNTQQAEYSVNNQSAHCHKT